MLDPKISVHTPENIEIQYSLAGIASRGFAIMVDTMIQIAAIVVLLLIFFITYLFMGTAWELLSFKVIKSTPVWALAILTIALYLIRMGYFTFFETVWSGQTPGKKILRIRVVKEEGYPIGFIEAMVRNLLRIVDILPGFYGVGIISIFISSREKRIGDHAAGTVVVKEKSGIMPSPEETRHKRLEKRLIDFGQSVSKVNNNEYAVIRKFLERRFELAPTARIKLAKKIAIPLIEKLEVPQPLNVSYEVFLIHLLHAYEESE